ncbi:MAG TPA: hypothetical protein DD435_05410 [Cyanobacteria bacterium UBA8530]|nr:hypothetical protein [Cyanobacteria bacterium UBA8530]
MLICPSCKGKHPVDTPSCSRCGAKLDQVRCLACGNWVPGENGRCPHCRAQLPILRLMLGSPPIGPISERYLAIGELGEREFLVQDLQFNREVPKNVFEGASPIVKEYFRLSNHFWLPQLHNRFIEPRTGEEVLFIEPRLNAQGTPLPTIAEFWINLREDERIRLLRAWLEMGKAIAPGFRKTFLSTENLVVGNYRLFARKLLLGESEAPLQGMAEQWEGLFGKNLGNPLREILDGMKSPSATPDEVSERLGELLKKPRIRWEHFAATDVGKLRDHNEDNYFVFTLAIQQTTPEEDLGRAGGLYAVCDGMGGHEGGEIASAMAVEAIAEKLLPATVSLRLTPSDLQSQLVRCIKQDINEPIFEANLDAGIPEQRRMGCTLILLQATGKRAVSVHVGDSRLYFLTRGEIQQLTQDHNLANLEYQLGHLTEDERDHISHTGIGKALTQALGPREGDYLYPEVQFYDVDHEGIFLLCSDGLTDMLSEEQIRETVALDWEDLEKAGKKLIALANEMGGADNITVALVRATPEPDLFS